MASQFELLINKNHAHKFGFKHCQMKARPLINAGTSIKLREPGAFIMFIENLDQIDKVSFSSAFVRASSFYRENTITKNKHHLINVLVFKSFHLNQKS